MEYKMHNLRQFRIITFATFLVCFIPFWQCATSKPTTKIFDKYDELSKPIGGFAELQRNLRYPEEAQRKNIQGRVIVNVLITNDGKVYDTKILKGLGLGCNGAAIDAIKKTKWEPAKYKGKPVTAWVALPVIFKLRK